MKRICILLLFLILSPNQSLLAQESPEANSLTYGFDLGASILVFAHEDFSSNFDEATYSPDIRGAVNLTYGKFRFEYGISYRSLSKGSPDITSYGGQTLKDVSSKINVTQSESLLLFVKNEENRIAFIGGGAVNLSVDETLELHYSNSTRESVKGSLTGSGIKLVVGGRDKDSMLKTTFSYTSVRVSGLSGKSFNLGGYALTFHLSFGAP